MYLIEQTVINSKQKSYNNIQVKPAPSPFLNNFFNNCNQIGETKLVVVVVINRLIVGKQCYVLNNDDNKLNALQVLQEQSQRNPRVER